MRLTVTVIDLMIYKGISFNLPQKPIFKKVLELAIIFIKDYDRIQDNLSNKSSA